MTDLYEFSTPELVRLLGTRFKEYRMRCNLTQKLLELPESPYMMRKNEKKAQRIRHTIL